MQDAFEWLPEATKQWMLLADERLSLSWDHGSEPPGGWPTGFTGDGHRYHRMSPGASWGACWVRSSPDTTRPQAETDVCDVWAWDVGTGQVIAKVPGRASHEPIFLDDERLVVAGLGVYVVGRTGTVLQLDDQARDVTVSPDGNLLALTGCKRGRLWNLSAGHFVATWTPEIPKVDWTRTFHRTIVWWHPTRPYALEGHLYEVYVEGRHCDGIYDCLTVRRVPSFKKVRECRALDPNLEIKFGTKTRPK